MTVPRRLLLCWLLLLSQVFCRFIVIYCTAEQKQHFGKVDNHTRSHSEASTKNRARSGYSHRIRALCLG